MLQIMLIKINLLVVLTDKQMNATGLKSRNKHICLQPTDLDVGAKYTQLQKNRLSFAETTGFPYIKE